MKLVWHLFRKDLARVKFFAAALLLLAALRPLLGVLLIAQDDLSSQAATRLQELDGMLLMLLLAGSWLLALWLVQLDSPRRSGAFLHTRPVSRGTLWSAKLLGAWTLCALAPLLAWLPWWLHCGMAAPELRALSISHAGGLALFVVPALILGALIRDYRRAVLGSIVFAVVTLCLCVLVSHPGESRLTPSDLDGVVRVGVWLLLGFTAALSLLGLLYRRQPGWKGFAAWVAAVAALGGGFHQTYWPAKNAPPGWEVPGGMSAYDRAARVRIETSPWTEENAAAFADLQVDQVSLTRHASVVTYTPDGQITGPAYTFATRATGAAGLSLQTRIEAITFTARDGASVRFEHCSLFSYTNDDFAPILASRSSAPGPDGALFPEPLTHDWSLREAEQLDTLADPLTVEASLRVTVQRPVLVSRQPLEPGGWHRITGKSYRIRSVREATDGFPGLELKKTTTEFDASDPRALLRWLDKPREASLYESDVFDARGHRVWNQLTQARMRVVAGVRVCSETCVLRPTVIRSEDGKELWPLSIPEWRAGLSYAVVRVEPAARLRRELTATDLSIERKD